MSETYKKKDIFHLKRVFGHVSSNIITLGFLGPTFHVSVEDSFAVSRKDHLFEERILKQNKQQRRETSEKYRRRNYPFLVVVSVRQHRKQSRRERHKHRRDGDEQYRESRDHLSRQRHQKIFQGVSRGEYPEEYENRGARGEARDQIRDDERDESSVCQVKRSAFCLVVRASGNGEDRRESYSDDESRD